jgi:two-component system, NtrC family, sensor histidine kinase HydH
MDAFYVQRELCCTKSNNRTDVGVRNGAAKIEEATVSPMAVELLSKPNWVRVAILSSIPVLVSTHWLYANPDKQIHNLLYHLDVIPLLLVAMLYGWRTSLLATTLTLAAEVPQLWILWPGDTTYRMDQMGETIVTGIAGLVIGLLADRGRRQTAELKKQSTQLETMNATLQSNMERLKKAERLYAVGQMAASLAHEIRNPLAGIAGAAGILKRGHASSQNMEDCCEIIDKESQRLNKLLAEFLSFARPRPPRLQPTDIVAVIDSVISLVRHTGRADNIEFRRLASDSLPEIWCDAEQIKQVLLNLVMNAMDAAGGGAVTLEAARQEDELVVTVEDEGSGVPAGEEERMFEPFFTTKETGSGLGLAIAAQIVEQHGGALTAQNIQQKGLRMILRLPAVTAVRANA